MNVAPCSLTIAAFQLLCHLVPKMASGKEKQNIYTFSHGFCPKIPLNHRTAAWHTLCTHTRWKTASYEYWIISEWSAEIPATHVGGVFIIILKTFKTKASNANFLTFVTSLFLSQRSKNSIRIKQNHWSLL